MSELLTLYSFSVARVTVRPANPSTWNLIRMFCCGELSTTTLVAEPALVSGEALWIVASSNGAKVRVTAGKGVGVGVSLAAGLSYLLSHMLHNRFLLYKFRFKNISCFNINIICKSRIRGGNQLGILNHNLSV